jgi:hypothetical protein
MKISTGLANGGDVDVDSTGVLNLNLLSTVPMERASHTIEGSIGVVPAQPTTNSQTILLTRSLVTLTNSSSNQVNGGLKARVAGGEGVDVAGGAIHFCSFTHCVVPLYHYMKLSKQPARAEATIRNMTSS